MKIILLPIALVFFCGCQEKPWNKASIKKECMKSAQEGVYTNEQKLRVETICDCYSDKMLERFKSEQEANENSLDLIYLINECRNEYNNKLQP
jgi:hypothetical protein